MRAKNILLFLITCISVQLSFGQLGSQKSDFWRRVNFGGGLGLGFTNGGIGLRR